MTKRVQIIGHIRSAADLFLGRIREITVNTTDKALRVHDGATVGGIEHARADLNNVSAATVSDDGKMSSSQAGDLSTTKTAVDAHIDAASGHPVATVSADGFESAADKTKLDGIETAATADQSAAEILAAVKTVDGPGSGLNADLLDDESGSFYASVADLAAQLVTLRGELNAPTSTKALFPQTSAPTGWTKDTDQDNKALRIVSGGTGGSAAGVTAFNSVFGSGKTTGNKTSTGTVGGTAISISQMPSHAHTPQKWAGTQAAGHLDFTQSNLSQTATSTNEPPSTSTGGGNTHTHSLTMNAHNHTLSLDLQYLDIIKATKDA